MRANVIRVALVLLMSSAAVAARAGIVFVPGQGVTPERMAGLQAAAAEIEETIAFSEEIRVSVEFRPLQCDPGGIFLGFGGPQTAFINFPGAPQQNVLYVSAQAADLGMPKALSKPSHIQLQFNDLLGTPACSRLSWYYGTDHDPGFDEVDFVSVAAHELMHGLGFLSFIGKDGQLNGGKLDNYSTFLFDITTGKYWKDMSAAERVISAVNDNQLVWNGAKTTAMTDLLQSGTTDSMARIYAPSSYENGSSTSHFDVSLQYIENDAHEIMEPIAETPEARILAGAAFCDMGWRLLQDTDEDGTNDCDDADPLFFIDTDSDGVEDAADTFPLDPAEWWDTDTDGIGNNADPDDDNDGLLDGEDNCPLQANTSQRDYDNNGQGDACDPVPMPVINGDAVKGKAGAAVAFAGDVDGDSYGDYVIGMPGFDPVQPPLLKPVQDAGRVMVVSGRTREVLMEANGLAVKDALGFAVAGGGDVDGDGFDDLLAGAPYADVTGATVLKDAGSVTLLYGPDAGRREIIPGEVAKALAGSALALGDVNNDGHADILIGAPKDDDTAGLLVDAGSVTVISGSDLQVLHTFYGDTAKAYAGTGVATGAIDNTPGAEVIVGAPGDNLFGSATVYNIATAAVPVMKKTGLTRKSAFGAALASADVDGDGRDDLLVGAPLEDDVPLLRRDAGSVAVFSATGDELVRLYGDRSQARLGTAIATADLDGDGLAEAIAGAPRDDKQGFKLLRDTGSVKAWTGDGFFEFPTLYGFAAKDYFGTAVAAGDIDGDGRAEIIVGAPGADVGLLKDVGAVWFFTGEDLLE